MSTSSNHVAQTSMFRQQTFVVFAIAFLWTVLLLSKSTVAQPPPPLPSDGASVEEPQNDSDAAREPQVRRLYVPMSELKSLMQQDDGSVLLSRDEFNQLWFAAEQAQAERPQAPADIVLSSVDYQARIENDRLLLSTEVVFTQFDTGWQVLRLPMGGLSVEGATLDGKPAAVSRDPEATDTVLIFSRCEGTHRLNLDLSASINAVGSDGLMLFDLPGAPSGTLRLSLPDDKSLVVDGLTVSKTGDEYRIPVGGKSQIALRLSDGDATQSADELLFASTAYGLDVAPGEVTWSTNTTLTAYGRTLDRLQLTVPVELDVVSVESLGLASWDMNDTADGDRTELTLTYRQPFDGSRDVLIRGVFVPDEEWSVPTLLLEGVDSHVGTVIVQHDPDLRLQPNFDDTIRPATAEELKLDPQTPTPEQRPTMGFHAMQPEFELSFFTPRKTGTVQVAMTNLLHLSDDGLDLTSVLDVEASVAPLFDIRLLLPADFEVAKSAVDGRPVEWTLGTDAVGQLEVRLPLDPPLHPGESRRIDLTAHADPEDWPVENDPVLIAFPEVGLPQADMIEARYAITADEELDVETIELTGLDPARGEQADALKRLLEPLGRSLRLGFTYQDSVFSGQLEVTRRPSRLSTSTLLLSRLEPQRAVTRVRAAVTVEGGGLEGLLITLPEDVDPDARFSITPPMTVLPNTQERVVLTNKLVSIVEQTVSEPIDGERTWTLRFDRRLHGAHELMALLTQPREGDGEVSLPIVTFTGADRQNGWIAVEARDDQRLTVRATDVVGQPLRAVDPIDIPGMAADDAVNRRIVGGFRFARAGASAAVSEEQFDRAVVPTAVVDQLSINSVLGEAGDWQHRLNANFRAVGVQSLLVALPVEAELWSVQVDGQPIEVRQSVGGYQVPLPTTTTPADSSTLQVFYRTDAGQLDHTGRLQQTEPQLAIQHGNGQTQTIDILTRDWSLSYPHDVVLLDSEGIFTPTYELRDDTIFGRLRNSLTLPTWESAGWRFGIAFVSAFLVWLVIRTTKNREWAMSFITVAVLLMVILVALVPTLTSVRSYAIRDSRQPMREELEVMAGAKLDEAEMERILQPSPVPASTSAVQQAMPESAVEDDGFDLYSLPVEADSINGQTTLGFAVEELDAPQQVGGALLSLSLDLDMPGQFRETSFTSLGTRREEERSAIDVSYASRSSREVMFLLVAAGVTLLMWWLRFAGASLRGVGVVLAVLLPLALVTVMPSLSSIIVEGVLLGGVLGVILWAVRRLVASILAWRLRWWPTSRQTEQAVAGLLIFGCWLIAPTSMSAEEKVVRTNPLLVDVEKPPTESTDEVPTVIIPFGDENPLDAERVLLSRELFERLQSQASPDSTGVGPAPVDGVIAAATYEVQMTAEQSDVVEVIARFALASFRDEPVALPLPLGQVAVTSAKLGEVAGIVRPTAAGGLEVVVPDRGQHELTLAFTLPAELQSNSGEFSLPLKPVAAGQLSVSLPPREDLVVSVERGDGTPIGYRRQSSEDRVRVTIPVDQGGDVTMSWQPEQTAGGRDGIVHVESMTAIQLDDAGVGLRGMYDVNVRQGKLSRLTFDFPESVRLKRLWGADVGGWQIDGEADKRTITVFLRRTVDDQTRLFADLFVPEAGSGDEVSFDVPSFAPKDVTRESGQVVILADAQRDVRVGETNQVSRINALNGELPEELNPNSLPVRDTYRFTMRPWSMSVSASLRPPESRVTAEYGMFVRSRKILLGSRLRYELAGAPRRLLRVLLPQDFLMIDLLSPDASDWFVENGELVLDLGQPRLGNIAVTFEGHVTRDASDAEAVLETPLLLGVDRQETHLAVWVEEGLSATVNSFEGWRTVQSGSLTNELLSLDEAPVQFAFRTTSLEPELIILQLDRAQPRLACDAVTLIAASDTSLDYGLTLRWTIERATTDRLVFTTPGWLDGRLEFTGPGIRQTTSTILDDGRIRWEIELQDAVQGQYLLSAIATLPPPPNSIVHAPDVQFEQPSETEDEFVDVAAQQSFAVLVNLSSTQMVSGASEEHDVVQRENLPLVLRSELVAQAMEMARLQPGQEVSWQMQRVTEQMTATATVTAAELKTMLAADGSWRTEASYRVRNRGHQFLAVRVPSEARLLSVMVKDQPARISRTILDEEPVLLVPLPQTSAADLSFTATLVLQGEFARTLPRTIAVTGEHFSLPVPRIVTPRESIEYGVLVAHTNWTVTIPDEFAASVVEGEKSNVEFQPAGDTGYHTVEQTLQELSELSRLVADSKASYSQRSRAAKNLKKLESELEEQSDEYSLISRGDSSSRLSALTEQQEQLLSESRQNAFDFESQLGDLSTGDGISLDGVQDLNESGTNRGYILGNSVQIAADNGGMGIAIPQRAKERFGFDDESLISGGEERSLGRKAGTIAKDESNSFRSRSQLQDRLSQQAPLTENAPAPAIVPSRENSLWSEFSQPLVPRGGRAGGGGFGGAADFLPLSPFGSVDPSGPTTPDFGQVTTESIQSGGLSLPINVPVSGRTLTFTRQGGDPVLTLAIRPRESVEHSLRWLWTALWIGLAAFALWLLVSSHQTINWPHIAGFGCVLTGLFALLLLPSPVAWLGLPVIVIGSVLLLVKPGTVAA
ncbi:MAG: hypothetical protein KDA93_20415 [Planctomycetaceae bacterium]|nr:hypothetical protein [Planctomycetaceae bacterium]